MKLTLFQPGVPNTTHEAELVSATGFLLNGDRTYKFKGPFPVDPKPYQYPPLPEPPPGEIEGPIKFYTYQRVAPDSHVSLVDGSNLCMCTVEENTPEGFTLVAFGGGNLRGIEKLNFAP